MEGYVNSCRRLDHRMDRGLSYEKACWVRRAGLLRPFAMIVVLLWFGSTTTESGRFGGQGC